MIQHMVGAEIIGPFLRFRARRSGDHREIGQCAGELDGDRADAAGAANDQDRIGGTGNGIVDLQPVKQCLPGGERGQGQGGGCRIIQRFRLLANDALIDQVKFRVCARPVDGARIEYSIARLEQLDARADRLDDPRCVPSQHFQLIRFRLGIGANLHVNRVDRDRLDLDQDVAALRCRFGQVHIDQRGLGGNGLGNLVGNGAHGGLLHV